MKPLLNLFFILLCAACTNNKTPKAGQFYDPQEQETGEVYVCTGEKSHAYHSNENCYGLSRCSRDIIKVTIEEAKEHGRTPCHYCHK